MNKIKLTAIFKKKHYKVLACITACIIFLPAQRAHAESGYRICAAFQDHGYTNGISRGLAAKIAKNNGYNTCDRKMTFMNRYYRDAYNENANIMLEWIIANFSALTSAPTSISAGSWKSIRFINILLGMGNTGIKPELTSGIIKSQAKKFVKMSITAVGISVAFQRP